MVTKLPSPVIEDIDIKFSFSQELITRLYNDFSAFSDKIEFTSNGYSYSSLQDFKNNVGLVNFNDWEFKNFGSKAGEACSVEFNGKKLRVYYSDISSPVQQNFQGKIKQIISNESRPKKNEIQLINETTIEGVGENGHLSFYKRNRNTIITIVVAVFGGAIATIVGGVILKNVFNIS